MSPLPSKTNGAVPAKNATIRILVLSDTHIPKTAQELPQIIYDEIKNVDMVFHAGDFVEKELFDKLNGLAELVAVCGNMDSMPLKAILNEDAVIKIGRFRIGLTHGYGPPGAIIDTVRRHIPQADAIIFGHSHSPINITKDGILFFNPGSPTDKTFAPYNSFGIITVDDDKIEGRIVRL